MSWISRLTIPIIFLLLSSQYGKTAAQNNPWSSPERAEDFLSAFMDAMATNPNTFLPSQIDDMRTIADSILGSMDKMASSGRSSESMLHSLNMAFASSVADLAVTESGGSSLSQKTEAIAYALSQAFLQTTGVVNETFISEIRSLISMFAQASANDVSGDSGSGTRQSGPYSSSAAAAAAAAASTYGSGPSGPTAPQYGPAPSGPLPGQYGPSGPSGPLDQGNGPYGPSSSSAAAAAASQYGPAPSGQLPGQYGPSPATTGPSGSLDTNSLLNSASRLSSSLSSARVSSAVSTLLSSGGFNPSALSRVISDLSNSVSQSQPGLSGCEILVQVLLEVIVSLVHILSSSSVGQVNNSPAYSSSVVGQSFAYALGG